MASRQDFAIKQALDINPKVTDVNNLPPHYSNVINSFRNPNLISDPTTLGFRLFFHFGEKTGLLADKQFDNSAEAYFERTGQLFRRDILNKFKNHLSNINSTFHFLFQNIEGLNSFLEYIPGTKINPENRLVIQCLETIDWKIQVLNEMYAKLIYDYNRGIETLPLNLRRFSMSIYIYDKLILNDEATLNNNGDGAQLIAPTRDTINDVTINKHIMFDLTGCEFDSHTSGTTFFDSVSNAEVTDAKNNIAIKYMRINRSALFKHIIGESSLNDTNLNFIKATLSRNHKEQNRFKEIFKTLGAPFYKAVEDLREKYPNLNAVKKAVNVFAEDLAAFEAQQLVNSVNSRIQRLFLGNVYELDPADIFRIAQSETFLQQFANINDALENARRGVGTGKFDLANDIKHLTESNVFGRQLPGSGIGREPIPPRNVYNP